MEFDTHALVALFGLVGAVIVGGALLAGPTERTGLPALVIFLLLGLALGPYGLRLVAVSLEDPLLRVVATLSLTLVLFTDAMTLDLGEVRRNATLAALILGPGTLLAAIGLAALGWALLGLAPVAAIVLGAAVASTDPVVLRGMLQGSGLPDRLRLALRLESGMNDVLLLPIVVIALAFGASGGEPAGGELGLLLLELFVLGPLAGVIVGLSAVRLLAWVRDRFGVRREYEALYVIGVALAAFAAAEALGGSGFLAAFAAGLVVSSLDVELCDCFLEYGQVTAEMALLFTFVLLGTAPIWSGLGVIGPLPLLFAAVALLVRLPIFAAALKPLKLPLRERLTLGWYGPRGLGSLLLALLAVFDGLPGGEQIVALASLVVLLSLALQGGWPLLRRRRARPATPTPPLPHAPTPPLPHSPAPPVDRITIERMRLHQSRGEPLVVIDARTERSYHASDTMAAGALRIPPDRAVAAMKRHGVPADAWVVAYCT
jgi:NhaP-type Na+/H+ or K+/H+ antiporter